MGIYIIIIMNIRNLSKFQKIITVTEQNERFLSFSNKDFFFLNNFK